MTSSKKIKLKIATPERVVLENLVDQVTIPTENGEITVLPGHISLITSLIPGTVETKTDGNEVLMAVSGGFLEFHENQMTVLADTAERAEEIDLERAEQARRRAEELKTEKRKSLDEEQFAAVVSQIEKQMARVRLAKKYRTKTGYRPEG
jgi:F-type H+-transporting ATPase subunit epsilon